MCCVVVQVASTGGSHCDRLSLPKYARYLGRHPVVSRECCVSVTTVLQVTTHPGFNPTLKSKAYRRSTIDWFKTIVNRNSKLFSRFWFDKYLCIRNKPSFSHYYCSTFIICRLFNTSAHHFIVIDFSLLVIYKGKQLLELSHPKHCDTHHLLPTKYRPNSILFYIDRMEKD